MTKQMEDHKFNLVLAKLLFMSYLLELESTLVIDSVALASDVGTHMVALVASIARMKLWMPKVQFSIGTVFCCETDEF